MGWYDGDKVTDLIGKTLTDVKVGEYTVTLYTDELETYEMFHMQDCCEHVYVEDVYGDINDLVGSPITMAEEATSRENPLGVKMEYQESFTWTFYKFATAKGYVTIRWYGESNGYYSEAVTFKKIS